MKKISTFVFLAFFFGLQCSEEISYVSNWKPNVDTIEEKYNQINSIVNEIVQKLKILEFKVDNEPQILEMRSSEVSQHTRAHEFQKALEVLKILKKLDFHVPIKNRIDQVYESINLLNSICSKLLADTISTNIVFPDALASIVNEYALPFREIIFEGHEDRVNTVCYSPCGKYIASGSNDKTIRIWRCPSVAEKEDGYIETNQEIKKFEGHLRGIKSICYSLSGRRLVSTSEDGTLREWDLETNQQIQQRVDLCKNDIPISYSPCGKYRALVSETGVIKIRDLETYREIKLFEYQRDLFNVLSICYSPCGKYIASGSEDKTVRIWDVVTGKVIKIFKGHTAKVLSVCYSPCGKYVASGSADKTIRIWGWPGYA